MIQLNPAAGLLSQEDKQHGVAGETFHLGYNMMRVRRIYQKNNSVGLAVKVKHKKHLLQNILDPNKELDNFLAHL